MHRYFGLIGIFVILALSYAMSNNRKAISPKIVIVGLGLQWLLALFILKLPLGGKIFHTIGTFIAMLLSFSNKGAEYVFGVLGKPLSLETVFGAGNGFIFAFAITATIIFVCAIINALYYLGIMQRIVAMLARVVTKLMGVSGAEALSNVASVFVGQVEAQILIRPYIATMTMSELLASMSGSLACIAGGIMAVYISFGIPAEYLLAASIMAAPGAFVISKIVWPETEESQTKGIVKIDVEKNACNLIDAAAHGCSDGMRIALNVLAMLIGFIALIAMVDWFLGTLGSYLAGFGWDLTKIGIDLKTLNLSSIMGALFSPFAYVMGVPAADVLNVGGLMGTKIVATELVAYVKLSAILHGHTAITLAPKSVTIATFALCGFANFGSIAILIGGIGEIAPTRKHDLARLGMKALICGTLASYMSATIAGIIVG